MSNQQDWDQQQALQMTMGKTVLLLRLVKRFIEQLPVDQANIRDAIDDNNLEQVQYLSHSLKGICAQLYATNLQYCCSQLEHCAKNNQENKLPELMEEFEQYAPRLLLRFHAFVEQHSE